jgi:hypothetical protein
MGNLQPLDEKQNRWSLVISGNFKPEYVQKNLGAYWVN